MNRRISMLIILALASVLLIAGVSYAISPKEQAKIVAGESLPKLLKSIVQPEYKQFYFDSREQVMKAYLGEPIENYTIDLGSFDPNKSLSEQLKPFPFYVIPVMAEGKAITDMTAVLQNQKWEVVDIGGYLSKTVNDMSREHDLSSSVFLRFAGDTFVIARKDGVEVGYSPFKDYDGELEKRTLVSSDELRKILAMRQEEVLELAKMHKDGAIGGSANSGPTLEFRQGSVLSRLSKFIKHML